MQDMKEQRNHEAICRIAMYAAQDAPQIPLLIGELADRAIYPLDARVDGNVEI